MKSRVICTLGLAFLGMVPAVTFAQSGIAGVVKDSSGAVLPGVSVEAASPALIEKVRIVVTDAQGQYKIVDLRPGIYSVTFGLTGFNTVKRDGIDLPASFTATVNAELPVGALEETVTVTGEAPVVDVQGTNQTTVLAKQILDAVPTSQGLPQAYTYLLPGVVLPPPTGDGQSNASNNLSVHGSRIGEAHVSIDGFNISHSGGGGLGFYFYVNQGAVQEVAVSLGSNSAEEQSSGVVTNVIPKGGSNNFSGQLVGTYTNEDFAGDNLTSSLRALGVTSSKVKSRWDFNPSIGGPIKKDRLWFFASYRDWAETNYVVGMFHALNPTAWTHTPDVSRPATTKVTDRDYSLRLTWQAAQKHKIMASYDLNQHVAWDRNASATTTPDATTYSPYYPNYLTQLTWKSPLNNRLLLEGGWNYFNGALLQRYQPGVDPTVIAATELSNNLRFRAAQQYGGLGSRQIATIRASASYVTGSHAFKFGMTMFQNGGVATPYQNGDYTVSLRDGTPVSLTLFAPQVIRSHTNANLGVYAQDQWTLARLTLNVGVRYDYVNANVPAQDVPGNRWVSARHFDPVNGVPLWHDVSPRLGVAYDLFGNGRTALKATLNRYVDSIGGPLANSNPITASVISANRNWTDRNGNFIPECDFDDPGINGECGVLSNLNFGRNNPRATRNDPEIVTGFGKRGYNWESSATLQHELGRGLAVSAGYARRWYGNFTVTDNQLVGPADFDPFCLTVPRDSRLPGGGGNQICGFYDVSRAKVGQSQNLVTFASNFGEQSEVYNGFDFTVTGRLPSGAHVTAGAVTGRTSTKTCSVVDSPGTAPLTLGQGTAVIAFTNWTAAFCDNKTPFETQYKLLGVYPLPWGNLQASGSFISVPGPEFSNTSYVATNDEVKASLGRDLSAGPTSTIIVPLMQPGTLYGERVNLVDVRLSKIFRISQTRILTSLDVFNVFNSSDTQDWNRRYGSDWLKPTRILPPRVFQLAATLDF
jgi:Carboxypeptidase regulatory-like domain